MVPRVAGVDDSNPRMRWVTGILLQAVAQKQRYNILGCGRFLRGAGSLGWFKSGTCETCCCFWVDGERTGLDQGTPS